MPKATDKQITPAERLALGAEVVKTIGEKALGPSVRLGRQPSQAERDGNKSLEGPTVQRVGQSGGGANKSILPAAFSGPVGRLAHKVNNQGDRTLEEGGSLYDPALPALLVSFYYLPQFLENKHRYRFRDWVMDSGAFSAHNSGVEIKIEEYTECCKTLLASDPQLTEVYGLDVIGDEEKSLKNVEFMWKHGIPAIPTFHYGSKWSALLHLAKNYPKVAIGGCVGKRDKDKFASQCFARVWPKKIHGFGFGSEKSIMLLPWHSVDATNWEIAPCLAGETLISTEKGLIPIKALVDTEFSAYTHHQLLVSGCSAIRSGVKEILKVSLRSGQEIRATPNHKILTSRGWKKVEELGTGDRIKIVDRQLKVPELQDSLIDEMFGWLTGDGWHTEYKEGRGVVGILFAPDDQEAMDRLLPVWDHFVGRDYSLQTCNGVRRKSSEHFEVLAKFEALGFKFGTAPVKELPAYIFQAEPYRQLAFLRGLFSADGTLSKVPGGSRNIVRLSSVSRRLLSQVQLLLLDFGIQSRVYWSYQRTYKNPLGELNLSGFSARRYMEVIGFNLSKKTQSYQQAGKFHHQPAAYSEVVSIDQGIAEPVYDIIMPSVHYFVANGMAVHNCKYGQWKSFGGARISVRGSRQNLRTEVEWYLDLERRARERWKKEMVLLETLGPTRALALSGSHSKDKQMALDPTIRLSGASDDITDRRPIAFSKNGQEQFRPRKVERKRR